MILSSYLKTGIRNFLANRLSSFINVLGLAATIGVCIVVYLIVDRQLNLDHFHEDHERIFTVQSIINWENGRTSPTLPEANKCIEFLRKSEKALPN